MPFKLIRKTEKSKPTEVSLEIEQIIVDSLNMLGGWQWPGTYEVVRFSDTCWGVQSRGLALPPVGRYVVTVQFENHSPAYYEITHSNGNIGSATSRTSSTDYSELETLLRRCFQQFGPVILAVPFH